MDFESDMSSNNTSPSSPESRTTTNSSKRPKTPDASEAYRQFRENRQQLDEFGMLSMDTSRHLNSYHRKVGEEQDTEGVVMTSKRLNEDDLGLSLPDSSSNDEEEDEDDDDDSIGKGMDRIEKEIKKGQDQMDFTKNTMMNIPNNTLQRQSSSNRFMFDDDDDDDLVLDHQGEEDDFGLLETEIGNLKIKGGKILPLNELYQLVYKYSPIDIELDTYLEPFIPDYVPAIGDIDAFIKVPRPDGEDTKLGLVILDEPDIEQSNPTS